MRGPREYHTDTNFVPYPIGYHPRCASQSLRIVARSAPHERRSVILGLVVLALRKVILAGNSHTSAHADRRQEQASRKPFCCCVLASPDNSLVPSPDQLIRVDQAQQSQRARVLQLLVPKAHRESGHLRLRARCGDRRVQHTRGDRAASFSSRLFRN